MSNHTFGTNNVKYSKRASQELDEVPSSELHLDAKTSTMTHLPASSLATYISSSLTTVTTLDDGDETRVRPNDDSQITKQQSMQRRGYLAATIGSHQTQTSTLTDIDDDTEQEEIIFSEYKSLEHEHDYKQGKLLLAPVFPDSSHHSNRIGLEPMHEDDDEISDDEEEDDDDNDEMSDDYLSDCILSEDYQDHHHMPQDNDGGLIISGRLKRTSSHRQGTKRKKKKRQRNIISLFSSCPGIQEWIANASVRAGRMVNNVKVQRFIVFLIILNSIEMGVGTLPAVEDNPEVNAVVKAVDKMFLVVFTIELILHFVHLGLALFEDPWLLFDLFVVVTSWSMESFQIVRAFRIFRAVRLFARLKLLRNLVVAIFQVLPRITAIALLLGLINYIYAVLCTTLFRDLYAQGFTTHDYFGRLDLTYLTLFELMTLSWSNISRQVMAVYPWSWSIFVSFVFISAFIVYNLIIAVICDAVHLVEQGREGKNVLVLLQEDEAADEHCSVKSVMNRSRGSKDVMDDLWSVHSDHDRVEKLQARVKKLIRSQYAAMQAIEHALSDLQQLDQQSQQDKRRHARQQLSSLEDPKNSTTPVHKSTHPLGAPESYISGAPLKGDFHGLLPILYGPYSSFLSAPTGTSSNWNPILSPMQTATSPNPHHASSRHDHPAASVTQQLDDQSVKAKASDLVPNLGGDYHQNHPPNQNNIENPRDCLELASPIQSTEKQRHDPSQRILADICNRPDMGKSGQELMPIPKELLPPEQQPMQVPRRKSL